MNYSRFFIIFICLSPFFSVYAEDGAEKFYQNFKAKLLYEASHLDKAFFKKVFSKKNIPALFELSLEEEHELMPQMVISNKVRALSKYPNFDQQNVDQKIALIQDLSRNSSESFLKSDKERSPKVTWQNLINMNDPFRSFNQERQLEILMLWRELFREKVQDYVAYRSQLLPIYKYSLTSITSYDSNVRQLPGDQQIPASFSGRDDGQQLFVGSFTLRPFINNKSFSKDWEFDQNFKVIKISQFAHKENELMMLDVEPKLTRKLDGFFQKASLAYRYHNFYYNADTAETNDTRDIDSYIESHRLTLGFRSKTMNKPLGFVERQRTDLRLSYELVSFTDGGLSAQDADDYKLGASHTFYYNGSYYIKLDVEYSDYKTEAKVTQDYTYFKPKIAFGQNYRIGWKYPINVTESFEYSHKRWNDFLVTGENFTERLSTLKLSATTKLLDKLTMLLGVSETFRKGQQQFGNKSHADQFKAQIGFIWAQ